ncbi:Putative serine protease [Olavius algarvensis associated proteobacterium Delta 3]|nr:Putative serine protease [Olavius algarvensis associated proteobacterium Delta 3]CAB5117568.1 Putative serine protease [Olavius algarvensis associated proteobacterium Delta 3]
MRQIRTYARRPHVFGALFFLLLFVSQPAHAGVYKYQDEEGNWHFSDRPVGETQATEGLSERGVDAPQNPDLDQRLSELFAPKNDIERVSIATVAIHTAAGTGSGFFITDDGYILTNRHVLQGDKSQRQAIEQQYLNYKRQVDNLKDWVDSQKGQLVIAEARLRSSKQDIYSERDSQVRQGKQQIYEAQHRNFERWKANVRDKEYELSEFERKLDSAKLALDNRELIADLSQNFTIFLRDKTELYVYLVAASETYDLALLKLDGYKTPFLEPFDSHRIAQGEAVYAVGNPLNLRTQVAAGVLSGHQGAFVKTDARIYPGNSGGPLVTGSGRVIGINTFKQLTRKFEGLGFAIRIDIVLNEFSGYLNP